MLANIKNNLMVNKNYVNNANSIYYIYIFDGFLKKFIKIIYDKSFSQFDYDFRYSIKNYKYLAPLSIYSEYNDLEFENLEDYVFEKK
jgi:ribosomal protein S8